MERMKDSRHRRYNARHYRNLKDNRFLAQANCHLLMTLQSFDLVNIRLARQAKIGERRHKPRLRLVVG